VSELQSARLLRRFLGYTPNLEHLRLNLPKYQFDHNEQFLKWLTLPGLTSTAQSDFFEPPPISMDFLTTLELGQFQARPSVILDVIQRFAPTLRHLELWKMALSNAQAIMAHDPRPNIWKNFFTRLAKMPDLQLEQLKVGMLSQDHTHVQFKDLTTEKGIPGLKVKQYTGKKMDKFLRELTDDVFVLWPQDVDDGSDSEEDEDEEMADDDEDDEDHEEDDDDDGSDDE
jgi:hypothetical protein